MLKNCLLALALFVLFPAWGQAMPPAANTRPAQPQSEPERIVREGVGRLTAHIRGAQDLASPQVRAFLQSQIAPYFDFAYMARSASGPWYRRLSTVQRARLEDHIKLLFIATMANNLGSYKGQNVRIFSPRISPRAGKTLVRAILLQQGTRPIQLDFRFYRTPDDSWKVYDVLANGNSAIMYYRTHVRNRVRQYGPSWLSN